MEYDGACALLKSEIERQKNHNNASKIEPPISAARLADIPPPPAPKNATSNRRNIECHYCHKKGHMKNECRLRLRNERMKASFHNHCAGRGRGRNRNNFNPNQGHRNQFRNTHNTNNNQFKNDYNNTTEHTGNENEYRQQNNYQNQSNRPRRFFCKYKYYMSESSDSKSDSTWLDCGAIDKFVWDRTVFQTYTKIKPVSYTHLTLPTILLV